MTSNYTQVKTWHTRVWNCDMTPLTHNVTIWILKFTTQQLLCLMYYYLFTVTNRCRSNDAYSAYLCFRSIYVYRLILPVLQIGATKVWGDYLMKKCQMVRTAETPSSFCLDENTTKDDQICPIYRAIILFVMRPTVTFKH